MGVHIVASPCCGINISNISAWASRCRFIRRAMREPQIVERQPTLEARAETKFTLLMPCKEEDGEVNYRIPRFLCLVVKVFKRYLITIYINIKRLFTMKKIIMFVMAMLVACSSMFAQDAKEIRKERQEIKKMAKAELSARVDKTTKKEAKRLKKEGWVVSPGALPLEKQLERSYLMEFEFDENLFPKYIMANAQSIGENYDAAKRAATSLAITNLAGQIQTEVTALIENTVGNQQLAAEDAASIVETVMASKNLISQSIGRVITVVECYRVLDNKNREVMVRIAYNSEMAKQAVKQAVREDLKKKGENLHEQLDKALGF